MDAYRFDRLVASLARQRSRRDALRFVRGAVFAAVGLGAVVNSAASAKNTRKRRAKGKGHHHNRSPRAQALSPSCCRGGDCAPGASKNLAKCCYEDANLAGANFRHANLGEANFRGANLTNADFSNANLSKACLVDADITGAKFANASLTNAVYCRTKTGPNTFTNSGCNKVSACCPTCVPLGETRCANGGSCCGGGVCQNNTCVCPIGQQNCNGVCRDLQNDAKNCGACGNTCPGKGTCRNAQCRCGDNPPCAAGLTCCNGTCVDLLTDMGNCTACGITCPESLPNAQVFCGVADDEDGQPGYGCAYQCNNANAANCTDDPLAGCQTDISNDPNNCGKCGFECPAETPRCCGCKCFREDSQLCAVCDILTSARLIRRRP